MTEQSETRELHVAFTFRGLVTGWRCSVCGKEFHIPLEQSTDILAAPKEIQRDFDVHHCLKALADAQSAL